MRQTQEKFYSGVDLTFNTHPINNDVSVLYDEYSVEQNMYNVLMTNKGDAKFHPERCIGLRDLLFEPINIITESQLKIKIEYILSMWMPRVRIINIDVETTSDYDGYNVHITYITLNIVDEQTVTLFLDRIR